MTALGSSRRSAAMCNASGAGLPLTRAPGPLLPVSRHVRHLRVGPRAAIDKHKANGNARTLTGGQALGQRPATSVCKARVGRPIPDPVQPGGHGLRRL